MFHAVQGDVSEAPLTRQVERQVGESGKSLMLEENEPRTGFPRGTEAPPKVIV